MNIFKITLATIATCMALSTAFVEQAQAVPITGSVLFNGTVTLDGATAASSTAVTAWHFTGNTGSPLISGADGAFTGAAGTFATFGTPWAFASGKVGLWSIVATAGTFTFDLLTSTPIYGATSVTVTGMGIIHGPAGFDDTPGTWSFTTQDPSAGSPAVFSFSAASGSVPDGGSTVAFLGLALAGVEGLRRKIKSAKR